MNDLEKFLDDSRVVWDKEWTVYYNGKFYYWYDVHGLEFYFEYVLKYASYLVIKL